MNQQHIFSPFLHLLLQSLYHLQQQLLEKPRKSKQIKLNPLFNHYIIIVIFINNHKHPPSSSSTQTQNHSHHHHYNHPKAEIKTQTHYFQNKQKCGTLLPKINIFQNKILSHFQSSKPLFLKALTPQSIPFLFFFVHVLVV